MKGFPFSDHLQLKSDSYRICKPEYSFAKSIVELFCAAFSGIKKKVMTREISIFFITTRFDYVDA